jgi:hypothetical protein
MTDSLCWSCKKCVGACDWSAAFKPIKGWVAIKTEQTYRKIENGSYQVIECPLYEWDGQSGVYKTQREIAEILGYCQAYIYKLGEKEVLNRLEKKGFKACYREGRYYLIKDNFSHAGLKRKGE